MTVAKRLRTPTRAMKTMPDPASAAAGVRGTAVSLRDPQLTLFEGLAPMTSASGRRRKTSREIFTRIALDLLDCLDDLSPRTRLNPRHVHELAELLAEDACALPPITVVASSDRFLVVDGAHRVSAHRLLGLTTVEVELLTLPPAQTIERFAVAEAIERAARGPLPLSPADRKHSCDLLLVLWPELSIADVARRCGMTREGASKRRSRFVTRQAPGDGPRQQEPPVRRVAVSSPARLASRLLDGLVRLEAVTDGDEERIVVALVDATSREGLCDGGRRLDLLAHACAVAADRLRSTVGPLGGEDGGRRDA